MNIALLFQKRSALTEDGLNWLSGGELHGYTAARNLTKSARVSAILVRSLLACLSGAVGDIMVHPEGVVASVASKSSPGAVGFAGSEGNTWYFPHGGPDKVTYHIGVIAMMEALTQPGESKDLLHAYRALQQVYALVGLDAKIRPQLLLAADELYYWLVFQGTSEERAQLIKGADAVSARSHLVSLAAAGTKIDKEVFRSSEVLDQFLGETIIEVSKTVPQTQLDETTIPDSGFVGPQVGQIRSSIEARENILLAGPTGTGKTLALQQAVLGADRFLTVIEGKEGLTDLDFLGAILPQQDGSRRWVDGPLLRAIRQTQHQQGVLFLDEINRIPRAYLNLLIGFLNPKSGEVCRQMGLPVTEYGPFYTLEVPMTSEVLWCLVEDLRIVSAGNFGRAYAVYDLDPALRRRFDTVIEFDYLDDAQEQRLAQRTGLSSEVARALVTVARETRRLMANGELPGCIDTASLLNWARKCQRAGAISPAAVMQEGGRTWADTVCGRDHTGRVNEGAWKGLVDFLITLGIL